MVCHLIVFFSLSRLRGNDVASSPDLSGGGCCCNSSQHKIKKNKINNIFPRIGTFLTLRLPVLASKGTLWHSTEMLPPTVLTWPRWDSRAESKMLQLQFSLGLKKKTFLLSESFQRFSRSQITYKLWPDEARSVISVSCSVLFPCVGAKTKLARSLTRAGLHLGASRQRRRVSNWQKWFTLITPPLSPQTN